MGGCVGRRVPGAAGAGVEAEDERARRGRRRLRVGAWLREEGAGGRWAKRLGVVGSGVWPAAASGAGVSAWAQTGLLHLVFGPVFVPRAG